MEIKILISLVEKYSCMIYPFWRLTIPFFGSFFSNKKFDIARKLFVRVQLFYMTVLYVSLMGQFNLLKDFDFRKSPTHSLKTFSLLFFKKTQPMLIFFDMSWLSSK